MGTGTLYFVHGAGNRAPEAAAEAGRLAAGFGLADPSALRVSDWGQAEGPDAALPRLDATLPPVDAALALAPSAVAGGMLADPWAPLSSMKGAEGLIAPAANDDADRLLAFLRLGVVSTEGLTVTPDDLARAARKVERSPHYHAARGAPLDVLDAAATSAAALALQPRQARQAFGLPGIPWLQIDQLKGQIAQAVTGSGVLSAAGTFLAPLLGSNIMLWATQQVAPHRAEIMHAHILVAADVLFYERNGGRVRDHLRAEVAALPKPVVAMGHSLGGIALVDALFGPGAAPADVALLVTFGSQSAFLASIGALDVVTPTLPWLNIWSRNDFVSFLAAGLWPGQVVDHELVLGVGFPESHGAYAGEPAFFQAITGHPAFPAGLL